MRAFKLLLVVGVAGLVVFGVVPAASAAPLVTDTVDNVTYSADAGNVSAGATVVTYDTAGGTNVVIPSTVTLGNVSYSVTTIGDKAFQGTNLDSVTIPNSVTTIGTAAFDHDNLTSVTIPNSVTTIGAFAFFSNNLASVTIHDGLTTIGVVAFGGNLLTSVTIPNSVTTIDVEAFSGNLLTSVTIPNSVTTIGEGAFTDNKLTSVQFLGAAPTMGSASLGDASGLLVSFFARYGAPVVSGGYTTPHWTTDLYLTQALVSVSYSTNGGDGLAPPDSQPPVGSAFSAPADPSWAGHTFTGWFTAASGGSAWNFSTDTVSADTTLFAQWSSIPTLAATGIDVTQQSRITGGAATMLLLGIAAIIIHRRRRKANL